MLNLYCEVIWELKVLELSDREWTCKECGVFHDRDKNAANNIRDEGIRILKL